MFRSALIVVCMLGGALAHAEIDVDLLGASCPAVKRTTFGPFDYRSREWRVAATESQTAPKDLVEPYHFTPEVEQLIAGTTSTVGGDLSYTLRVCPNHHRALHSMVRLALRDKTNLPAGQKYTVGCFLHNAMTFTPDDGLVHLNAGIYLFKMGRHASALKTLAEAERLLPNNANVHYNIGLVHFERKDYGKARDYAKKAYGLGFPLPGLKQKLMRAGQWRDS